LYWRSIKLRLCQVKGGKWGAQVRVRTALAVQALCVIIAASRAAAVCASCCMITSPPAACLLKALAAQVAFGYALPITLLHAAEGGFRHVFAEACAYMA
jgi:hypothetical protein